MMPVSKPNSMPPSAPNVKMNALLSGKRVETPRPTSRSTASIVAPTSWMPASHRTFGVVYWIGRLHRSHDSTFHSHRSSSI